jgi:FkbM family methyltransferase
LKETDIQSYITKIKVSEIDSDTKVINEIIKRDIYKTKQLIRPDELWLDLGANIGIFSLVVIGLGGRVHAYEPCPRNIKFLETLGISFSPVAVSNWNGSTTFYLENKNQWRHTLIKTRGRKTINVNVIDSADLPKCDGIKMDIEGSEIDVIYGLKFFPKYLVLEYDGGHHPLLKDFNKLSEFLKSKYVHVKHQNITSDITWFPNGITVICHTLIV